MLLKSVQTKERRSSCDQHTHVSIGNFALSQEYTSLFVYYKVKGAAAVLRTNDLPFLDRIALTDGSYLEEIVEKTLTRLQAKSLACTTKLKFLSPQTIAIQYPGRSFDQNITLL
jgi:hypothetical protein